MISLSRKSLLTRNLIRYPGISFKQGSHGVKKKPLIFMFGWLGAAPKYLNKYESMYNNNGYDVITYTSPYLSILLMWQWKNIIKKMNQDIVEILHSKDLKSDDPIVIHLFSNNGFYTYCYFQYLLKITGDPHKILPRLKGTIIDSAPCHLNEMVLTKGFVDAIPPKAITNKDRIFKIAEAFFTFVLKFRYFRNNLNFINSLMDQTVLPSPQLYLYSEEDELIGVKDVEEYIEHVKKKLNVQYVDSYNFKDSQHVQHFRKYPDIYKKCINEFLNKVEEGKFETLE